MTNLRAAVRLERLSAFLANDPDNLNLLADAAATAREAGAIPQAAELLQRYEKIAELNPALLNLKGLIALDDRRFADAAATFEKLIASNADDPTLRFNLAWSKAVLGDYAGASALLDDVSTSPLPQAAALKIRVLHHLGEVERALELGRSLAKRFQSDPALMSALALVAIDAEDPELAEFCARRAGDSDEAHSTLGMLELREHQVDEALESFDRALVGNENSPRALLGKGLCLIAKGEIGPATPFIDRAAEGFGKHLGSWVAAGWAHAMGGDNVGARQRFEKCVSVDDNFAEGHGGLAVIDAMEWDLKSAKRRCEIALRLDPNCFSAALAKTLLLTAEGKAAAAARIRDKALNSPITEDGLTIAQAVLAFGFSARASGGKNV